MTSSDLKALINALANLLCRLSNSGEQLSIICADARLPPVKAPFEVPPNRQAFIRWLGTALRTALSDLRKKEQEAREERWREADKEAGRALLELEELDEKDEKARKENQKAWADFLRNLEEITGPETQALVEHRNSMRLK